MGVWRRLWRRMRYISRQRQLEAELAEELEFHRSMKRDDFENAGVAESEAMLAAQRTLGNDVLARNHARDVWIPPSLQDWSQDLRFAIRLLVKDRRFALAAIVALSLAIGANTTAFTFVNGAVFRDVPLKDPDRLVAFRMVDARQRPLGVSFADVRDWRQAARAFSRIVLSFDIATNVSDEGLPAQRYMGSYISIDAFAMVGHAPLLGRSFLPEDDRLDAPRVAIIAHTVWTTRYGSDPAIIGRTIRVNDVPTTIIGVMPERFHFPFMTEVWQPAALIMGPPATIDARRGNRNVLSQAYGRLADGVELTQAQAEMDTITARLARDYPDTNGGLSASLDPIDAVYRRFLQRMLLLVMGAVAIVLLIACVNIANLLLARASNRAREIAIRASLGGTRWRITRQLLIESAVLAIVAGIVGYGLSRYGIRIFESALIGRGDEPALFFLDFSLDWRVYAFQVGVCIAAVLLFGLTPALHIAKTDVNDVLKDGTSSAGSGVRTRRWTSALMVGELALTLVLLTGAALMLRSFLEVYQAARVLDTSNVVTMRLALSGQKYNTPELIKGFYRQLDERLATISAFDQVTVASDIPLVTLTNSLRQLAIDGRPMPPNEPPPTVAYLYIGPRYFETLRLRLLEGRQFTEHDGAPGQEAAIVNQRFVSMFFPDTDPLGKRIRLTNAAAPNAPQPWVTIVGVAPTIPQFIGAENPEPVVYVTVRGEPAPHRFASVIIRASGGDTAATVSRLREEVRKVDPSLPGYFVQTLDQMVAGARGPFRLFGSVFALLAGIALLLASVGLYAVTAHGVASRTREIGVRVAMGARSREVVWLFVKRTAVHLTIGLGIGIVGAIGAGRLLAQFLVRTPPTDPVSLVVVSLLLSGVALTACLLPARRASRIDPVVALRRE